MKPTDSKSPAKQSSSAPVDERDYKAICHDLQVHQTQLEMQNEELRTIQQELSLSRDRFSELFHNAPVGYVVLDASGIMSQPNRTLARMLGVEVEKLTGKALANWIAPLDRKVYLARFPAWLRDPRSKLLDVTLHPHNAQRFSARLQARLDPKQGSGTLLVTVTDISALIDAQASVREALEQQTAIFNTSLVGIMVLKNRVITQLNQRMAEMLGYEPSEILGQYPEKLHLSQKNYREFGESYYWRLAECEVVEVEYPLRHKDGHTVWCMFNGRAIHPPDMSKGAVWAVYDVTQKREMIRQIREAEQEWRMTFDASPDLISVVGTDFRIKRANRTLLEYVRKPEIDVIGKLCHEIIGHASICQDCPHLKVLKDGNTHTLQVTHDGSLLTHFEITCAPIKDHRDHITGTVHIAHDLRQMHAIQQEHIALEQQLHQNQKLESIGVLAGGVAHDFNNILQAIGGSAELAIDDLDDHECVRSSLEDILSATKHAASICQQMLTFAGKQIHKAHPVGMADLINDMKALLRSSIPKNITLAFNPNDRRLFIEGDEALMKQVLMNLVINAAEACGDKQGTVTIDTQGLNINADELKLWRGTDMKPGRYVALTITDTGSGMDKSVINQIFDPFYSTKFTGRGLGLATVLGICKAHHGGLSVTSEVGKGSIFTVVFPRIEPPQNNPVSPLDRHDAPDAMKNRNVLVVDDDTVMLKPLVNSLRRIGCNVFSATDGRAGLEKVREHGPDLNLVLCDVTMPEMSGDELLTAIRAIHPELPVILSSGYSRENLKVRLDQDRHTRFLQKPFRLSDLKTLVNEIL